jgi:hypothetical protein
MSQSIIHHQMILSVFKLQLPFIKHLSGVIKHEPERIE